MPAARHQYEIYIRATPEEVWTAITDPSFTRQYFHGTAWDEPPVEGEPFRTSLASGGGAVDGVVEVADRPRRLVHTWHTLYDPELAAEPPSRVEWHIDPAGEGLTRLRLVHGDLGLSPKTWANVEHGWVWILDAMKTLLETGERLPPVTAPADGATVDDPAAEWHRMQGIEANNSTWELIDKTERSADDDEEMLRRAYASSYHWARAARREPANDARGAWMLAKVQLLVGQPELSRRYAERCMDICRDHGLKDFDLAYAHEATARALQALGREAEAAQEWAAAKAVPIADEEDRKIFEADTLTGP
jgi:uncharacterized protein YndB with AHSA1/START domain